MKVIIGLGNPGKEYEKNRHNAGFIALDKIAEAFSFENFAPEEKFEAEISKGEIKGEKVILAKPQTFMNSSGRAAQKILSFYKLGLDSLIVIHDDLDIALGEMRLSLGSRSAGHRGVQSIIDSLGSQDYRRIRIGIKIENRKVPTEKFVLGNFTKEEMAKIGCVINSVPEIIEKELI